MVATTEKFSHLSHLVCSQCEKSYDTNMVNTFASCSLCGKTPLLSVYEHLAGLTTHDIETEIHSMWRYFPMLPVFDRKNIVSLGEGLTPIISADRLAREAGMHQVLIKDESLNPTGSFKARGMSVAISKAKELGITKCIVPTAGNAGGAMSAYCAKAGMDAVVVMPEHTPEMFKTECRLYGAQLILEKGLISDCARKVQQINDGGEYFDLSTLKEPYRLEGKKTMGYEIAEQLKWKLPDTILYPTGGGTGLIGMWKAFSEMIEMGWIPDKMPRMIAIQSEHCQPIVETWIGKQKDCRNYKGDQTFANGLAVPNPFGESLILKVLRETNGKPMAVSDRDIKVAMKEVAKKEGILMAPEGAALWAALKILRDDDFISEDESVLLLNTGSGYKYLETLD